MSAGELPIKIPSNDNYESDNSLSSELLFDRSSVPVILPSKINTQFPSTLSEQIPSTANVTNDEQQVKLNAHVRCLEDKINHQNATLNYQHSEIINLQKIITDLSNQFHQLKSAVNSPTHTPISHSQPNSTFTSMNNDYAHAHLPTNYSHASICHQQSNHTRIISPTQMKSADYAHSSSGDQHFRHFQDILHKTTAALERRDLEIELLKKQIHEIRCNQSLPDQNLFHASTSTLHVPPSSSQPSQTSAFVPIHTTQPTSILVSPNSFNTTSIMPFTMSLTNTLPSFSGKETEMPTKFITEFEVRASGLVGNNDAQLLRAVQQVLSDTALTWLIQIQQEQTINTWVQFKQLFLRRFRTPEKIESLRGRLRTLWQGDNEPTADYFERLKALMSEIEPNTSIDYLKRKFFQKLRKDIRDKMTLGLTSTLSALVQKALEIESNIIQQQIDDKLRAVQKEENKTKNSSNIVNHLSNLPQINSSHLSSNHIQDSYINYDQNYNYNKNQNSSNNTYSRTFINSTKSPPRTPAIQNDSQIPPSILNRNTNTKRHNTNRWCSFCSSSTHSWFRCYSNPKGPNYRPPVAQSAPPYQQPRTQPFISPSDYSQTQQHHSNQQSQSPPSHKNTNINQQQLQQNYQQPASSYSTCQPSSMSKNFQGSRY
jgi:hypothetical protein